MKKNTFYITKLSIIKNKEKNSNGKIANYILNNIQNSDKFTLNSIAENTDLSYATVCRFFKNLGCSGIKSFKKSISEEFSNKTMYEAELLNFSTDALQHMKFEQISRNVCNHSSSVVQHCYNAFDDEQIQNIINTIKKAKFVYFIGLGTSGITAKYAYTKFFRLEVPCSYDTDIIIGKMKSSILKKNDVLFAISSSGRTKSIVEVAKTAKSNGALVISLCDFAHSPLSHISDIDICTTARESNKYIDLDFPLIQGQITVIDILYLCFFKTFQTHSSNSFETTKSTVMNDKLT